MDATIDITSSVLTMLKKFDSFLLAIMLYCYVPGHFIFWLPDQIALV